MHLQAMRMHVVWKPSIALFMILLLSDNLNAQTHLLYSFETGLEGWGPTGFPETDFIGMATSSMGATQGSKSMAVETGPTNGPQFTLSWDVNSKVNPTDTTGIYDAFNTVAADLNGYTLDFDVTLTDDSYANVQSTGNLFWINVAVNSVFPDFPKAPTVTPNLAGLTGTFPVSIPMTNLPVAVDSTFYELNIGSDSDHLNGAGGEGVKYFVDNIRFTRLPELVEETLFSWETPDDLGTPGVNEQFENWTEGFQSGHTHAVTSLGATEGNSSLQIDRTGMGTGFSWGSQFEISSDTNPDPEIVEIDPTLQGIIDGLVGKINGAQSFAFDVRFDDAFPNTPTFTKFGIHVSDETGTFFDAEGVSFDGSPAAGSTGTVFIPLSSMVDAISSLDLATAGLDRNTNYLRLGISTNTDGGGIYQIDNFRIIREPVDSADFDQDGDVDGADFLTWQRGFGSGATLAEGDADGNGTVDKLDLAIWENQFGTINLISTPEPSAWILALLGCAVLSLLGRRNRKRIQEEICHG